MNNIKVDSRVESTKMPVKYGVVIKKEGVQGDLFLRVLWDDKTSSQVHQIGVNEEGFCNELRKEYVL